MTVKKGVPKVVGGLVSTSSPTPGDGFAALLTHYGVWTGTAGYGHPLSPGDPAGRGAAPGTPATEGSDAVNVGHGTPGALGVGGSGAGGHIPGADYGIPLDKVPGTAYGIPMDAGVTGAAAATPVPRLLRERNAARVQPPLLSA